MTSEIELLAPAKDLITGKTAIRYGADAVYIGAPKFGARSAVGNSFEDIYELISYAHLFKAKVYIVLNTILYAREVPEVEKYIWKLYEMGADAIIIQDYGILELNLPPIQLFSSTQMNNVDAEQVAFLEKVGFSRVILARELDLETIKDIRSKTNVDLESFVHGSLCVSYSGRCYLSCSRNERSANRGECAQPCRLKYNLRDGNGDFIVYDKHLLSLKDLDLSNSIENLLNAGITSFKIEGRLKDVNYVQNIVAHYNKKLNEVLRSYPHLKRASSGTSICKFEPNPEKSFHRSATKYFLNGRTEAVASIHTPKSTGERIGMISKMGWDYFELDVPHNLHNGDGLCFMSKSKDFLGTNINKIENQKVYPNRMDGLQVGIEIFRNSDLAFDKLLEQDTTERKIEASITLLFKDNILEISIIDEDCTEVNLQKAQDFELPQQAERNEENFRKQFEKTGGTIFEIKEIEILTPLPFLRMSELNELRRELLSKLQEKRLATYQRSERTQAITYPQYPEKELGFEANIANPYARLFLQRCGVKQFTDAFELEQPENAILMTCKHCIKYQLNACEKRQSENANFQKLKEPLFLEHGKESYRLHFNCKACQMQLSKN